MLEKSIKASSLFIIGVFLITMGILFINLNISFVTLLLRIVCYGLIIKSLINLFQFAIKKIKQKKDTIGKEITDILFSIIVLVLNDKIVTLLPLVFGLYFLAIVIIRIVDYYIYTKNGIKGRIGLLLSIIFNLITSLVLMINHNSKTKFLVIIIGIYLIMIGSGSMLTFLLEILPINLVNKIKMNIKIPVPEIFTAFIPQKLISLINEILAVDPTATKYNHIKKNDNSDIQVILHLAKNGTAAMGHIEIAVDDVIYSYGNYDMHSRSLFDSIGDGVILIVDKQKYIQYCVERRDRYLIEFGLQLTKKEKEIIKKNINDLINNNTIDYYSDAELMDQNKLPRKKLTDMSSEIYLYAGGKYKKIIKGKYKKFFVLNNNCAMMVKNVLKNINKDVLAINGILTPGAYYEYLNDQFMLKNTNVISRKIYTKNTFK